MIAKSENKKLIFMSENLSAEENEKVADHITKFLKSKDDMFMILSPFAIQKVSEDKRLVVLKLRRT